MPTQTSPLAGNRTHRTRNPRDITGREYQRLHAEEDAKKAAENLDIAAVRRAALTEGHAQGYEAGFVAGWDALAAHLVEVGVLAPDDEAAE
jgi:hypothetical protein